MAKHTLKEAVETALLRFPFDSTKELALSDELVEDLAEVLQGTINCWLLDLTDTNSSKKDPHTSTKHYGVLVKKRHP